jgi:hypothetical protein
MRHAMARTARAIGPAYRAGWRTEIFVPSSLQGFRATGACDVTGRTILVDTDDGNEDIAIETWTDD